MRAGLPVHHRSLGDNGAERHAGGNSLRGADDVRFDAGIIHGPPLAGAAHARLHFIGDEHDSVLAADFFQALQEFRGGGQITAFALDRLDENSGYFVGIYTTAEEFIFEIRKAIGGRVLGTDSVGAAVGVRIRHVKHAGEEGAESFALDCPAGGE